MRLNIDKKKKKKVKEDDKNTTDNQDTMIYKPVKKKGKKKKHPKLRLFLKIMLITFILLAVIGGRNICGNIV